MSSLFRQPIIAYDVTSIMPEHTGKIGKFKQTQYSDNLSECGITYKL
jgi:hypothetical protein